MVRIANKKEREEPSLLEMSWRNALKEYLCSCSVNMIYKVSETKKRLKQKNKFSVTPILPLVVHQMNPDQPLSEGVQEVLLPLQQLPAQQFYVSIIASKMEHKSHKFIEGNSFRRYRSQRTE